MRPNLVSVPVGELTTNLSALNSIELTSNLERVA